ncbi:MAG: hypothetical protein IKJ16_01265 [Agathobacter sp.]|nr:hypothetical protein [Agathobacter sp.]
MTKESTIRIHRIYNILFSIVLILAGICLIIGVLTIYKSGDQPFSRESVAATFSTIAFPVYLALVMTIISFVWEFFSPSKKEDSPKAKDYPALLETLYNKKDFANADSSIKEEICALWKNRKLHIIIRTIVVIVCSVIFLFYALNSANYHQSEINASMISAMKLLVPCSLIAFGYALFVSYYNEKSFQKEIELVKKLPSFTVKDDSLIVSNEKTLSPYRNAILIAALILIVYGFLDGGTVDVLAKAINICTECIGLG